MNRREALKASLGLPLLAPSLAQSEMNDYEQHLKMQAEFDAVNAQLRLLAENAKILQGKPLEMFIQSGAATPGEIRVFSYAL